LRTLFKALIILGLVAAIYYGLYYFAPGLAEHPWIQPLVSPLGSIVESLKQYPAQFVTLIGGGMATAVTYMVNRIKSIGTQASQQVNAVTDQANSSLSLLNDNLKETTGKYETLLSTSQKEIGSLQGQLDATNKANEALNQQVADLQKQLAEALTQNGELKQLIPLRVAE